MEPYPCPDCGQMRGIGSWPFCPDHGVPHGGLKIAAIHTSERTVIYRNPRTGEVRYPPTNNQAMPEVYSRQGYERVELDSAAKISRFERETGRVHERSWYDPGSATAEREMEAATGDPTPPKMSDALKQRLVSAIS